jgi:hypothetical protein
MRLLPVEYDLQANLYVSSAHSIALNRPGFTGDCLGLLTRLYRHAFMFA